MGFDPGFKIGEKVEHSNIIDTFKSGNMGGMLPSNTTHTMVIISDYTKGLYHDRLINDVMHYTGTGKNGDQGLTGNPGYKNGILFNSDSNGVEIHLFIVTESTVYKYYGAVKLVNKPYQDIQDGEDGVPRQVWMFPVKPLADIKIEVPEEYFSISKKKTDSNDTELQELLSKKNTNNIDVIIKKHDKHLKEITDQEMALEAARSQFVHDYTIPAIYRLKKEEYVVGLDNDQTFCNRLESGLRELGSIKGSFADKFGVFYGKWGINTEKAYRIKGGAITDDADADFEKVKEKIINLLSEADKKDMDMNIIRNVDFQPLFKGKLLATYFPDKFSNVLFEDHCDYFLLKLGIKYDEGNDIFDKYVLMTDLKNANPIMKKWSSYGFLQFLYTYFKPTSEIEDEIKKKQKEKDKDYPKEYVSPIKISVKEWKDMVQNPDIFHEDNLELLKRIYQGDNHAKTTTDLSMEDSATPQSYSAGVVRLVHRIKDVKNLPPVIGKGGDEVFWRIPFWGKYRDDGLFEWKVRPELAEAMESLWPEIVNEIENEEEDRKLAEDAGKYAKRIKKEDVHCEAIPKPRKEAVYSNMHKTYPRDRRISQNALALADYKCELDGTHELFNRRNSDIPYTEPHHLIPMSQSDKYKFDLDREQNIVSLCCNCHKQIHLGAGAGELIRKLFDIRKVQLEEIGTKNLTIDELIKMY